MSFNRKNEDFLFIKYKTFAIERSPWQQDGVNSGVRLPNHYTHAKLKMPMKSKDIHHFINIILKLINNS